MPTSTTARGALLFLSLLLLPAATAPAQEIDYLFGSFVPFGQLEAQLDGRTLDDAEIFFAERAASYVLLTSGLDRPLLIEVRKHRVEWVSPDKVLKNGNGTANLLTEAVADTVGSFEVDEGRLSILFPDGRRLVLGPKPHLLGLHTAEDLRVHDASYLYRARLYPPSERAVAELRQETRAVTVRVYFGSWCATCARMVPWILRLDEALAGSRIRFEYYGMPPTMDDPQGEKAGVHGVPTMVVSVDGEELGRCSAPELGVPEKALLEILSGE